MVRPKICRKVALNPTVTVFKPRGVPARELEAGTRELDAPEATRLADFEGLYQEQAAERMHISRTTFGRVIESAHKKIADALLHGKALVFNIEEKPEE